MRQWSSSITEISETGLLTRGLDQEELIESLSYEHAIFFLITGRHLARAEEEFFRWVILSHLSHGITGQSTLAVRMAADCGSSFREAFIGGFSVGSGKYHQGGLEAAMCSLENFLEVNADDLEKELDNNDRIIGFGHRYYKKGDPRAKKLLKKLDEIDPGNEYAVRVNEISALLRKSHDSLHPNIEAACAACLLHLGFPKELSHLIIFIGRGPMFAAAYFERLSTLESPFPKLAVFDEI